MGMSASQVRLLELTGRKNDIGYQLSMLANQKVALSKDTQKVTRAYQEALNAKTLKWSNNNGASYIDLSYNNLMKPSMINTNKSVLLTDTSGRVVIDKSYLKYAQMISLNGAPGGTWDTNKNKILFSLLGIDENKINNELTSNQQIAASQARLDELKATEPSMDKFKRTSINDLLKKIDNFYYNEDYDLLNCYNNNYLCDGAAHSDCIQTVVDYATAITNKLSKYFYGNEDTVKQAVKSARDNALKLMNSFCNTSFAAPYGNGTWAFNHRALANYFFSSIACYSTDDDIEFEGEHTKLCKINWVDVDDPGFAEWESAHAKWEVMYEENKQAHERLVMRLAQELNMADEYAINFYNEMFTAIAENGWVYNEDVNDPEYLNQMLQNNMFTITSIESTTLYDEKNKREYKDYDYVTNIATSCNNIFKVSDSSEIAEAQAEYEYQKSLINSKESRIDTRMQNLQTEQSAINQMLESIQTQRDENIERNFTIMS